jgi:mono/diheme cytochrome c family protein
MGCHDGVTAIDAYGYVDTTSFDKKTTGSFTITGRANIGGTPGLHDDHPVSIDYPTSGPYETAATVDSYLEEGRVECGSCHRAHSFGSDTLSGTPARYILRVTRENSALCRVCHTF